MKQFILLISLVFTLNLSASELKKAYVAGGCFWGVEYHLEELDGVKSVTSGFMGGNFKNPSYMDVVYKHTGHVETVEIIYDPSIISYEKIIKTFFEIHDFTQTNGQGPDIGSQYLSVVFYSDNKEKETDQKVISILQNKGYKVATKIKKASVFYKAEEYHQDYYKRKGSKPYCHIYKKIF